MLKERSLNSEKLNYLYSVNSVNTYTNSVKTCKCLLIRLANIIYHYRKYCNSVCNVKEGQHQLALLFVGPIYQSIMNLSLFM